MGLWVLGIYTHHFFFFFNTKKPQYDEAQHDGAVIRTRGKKVPGSVPEHSEHEIFNGLN